MHVGVDEARHEPAAAAVDALAAVVRAQPGDPPAGHRDVDLEPLAREDGEHPRARDHEVGRLVAARDGDQARAVVTGPGVSRRTSIVLGARLERGGEGVAERGQHLGAAAGQQRLVRPRLARQAGRRGGRAARLPRRVRALDRQLDRQLGRRHRHQRPTMWSGRIGTRVSAAPVAARTAATTAGVEEMVGGSPTPRRP